MEVRPVPRQAPKRSHASRRKEETEDDELNEDAAEDKSIDISEEGTGLLDYSNLVLKPDHQNRPLWVCPNNTIFLETFSPIYKQAYDFLVAIAEPISRPQFIHEYRVTLNSLYAAASVGLRTEDIISGLQKLSKNQLTHDLIGFITEHTLKCGKVKLLLRKNRYFIESIYPDTLRALLKDDVIRQSRVDDDSQPDWQQRMKDRLKRAAEEKAKKQTVVKAEEEGTVARRRQIDLLRTQQQLPGAPSQQPQGSFNISDATVTSVTLAEDGQTVKYDYDMAVRDPETGFLAAQLPGNQDAVHIEGTSAGSTANQNAAMGLTNDDLRAAMEDDDSAARNKKVLAFEVEPEQVETVRKQCKDLEYPLLEEYDFRKDTINRDLPIALKPSTAIRPYQEKTLSKMFGNGRARSGIIVLPCGAGKTLVGIAAASTVKKSTLVFCNSSVSVVQWCKQFKHWASIEDKYVSIFTAPKKDKLHPDVGLVITTYFMVDPARKRSEEGKKFMEIMQQREWGLVIMDEVHVVPARTFRSCMSVTHSRCKLGLTATLLREDDLIKDLYYLIGPKLYEANWLDLQRDGYLARVQCVEVTCAMTTHFYDEYLKHEKDKKKQRLLYEMNPNKFRACQYLIRMHEERGDKVLVFSDHIFPLQHYAKTLKKAFLCGSTSGDERLRLLAQFQRDSNFNCLFISSVGDTSIDLPDANVIIQISSHYSSRRQEAQRMGRILRPKSRSGDKFNAYFYTLVSQDTKDMFYSAKRRRYLIDQGYAFQVQPALQYPPEGLMYTTEPEQKELLARTIAATDIETEASDFTADGQVVLAGGQRRVPARKAAVPMSTLSGGDGQVYSEISQSEAGAGKPPKKSGGSAGKPKAAGGPKQGTKRKAGPQSKLFRTELNKRAKQRKQMQQLMEQDKKERENQED